jgi:phenylacetate-CoA ligase
VSHLYLPKGYQSAKLVESRLKTVDEQTLQRSGAKRALELFHEMAVRVPAYKDFLASQGFNPSSVESIDDFHTIPPVDKDTYLRRYPHEMLCWDGEFPRGQWVISSTSGTTGEPFYFPRQTSQDAQYALTAELYLRDNFQIHTKSTLYIVAFPMGAWIGGLFTYEALRRVADSGTYDLSIITPGIHKNEIISAVRRLGDKYDQVIIGAYAPFLRDIIADGKAEGLDWTAYNLGFVFSAEAFSETFRDYVIRETQPSQPLKATLNHYGTVDLGTMAHETPESILVRRTLVEKNMLDCLLPEARRQPTLAQYNPELFYFEQEGRNLYCSAYSGIPLVRYDLKDYGGVIPRRQVHDALEKKGINIDELAVRHAIDDTQVHLPYVYVYERDDLSVSYYGFLLYPDMIRSGLEQTQLAEIVTGKFSMQVQYSADGRQNLKVYVELQPGSVSSRETEEEIIKTLHATLLRVSSEYRESHRVVGDSLRPVVTLKQYGDPEYFKTGTKQRWTIR